MLTRNRANLVRSKYFRAGSKGFLEILARERGFHGFSLNYTTNVQLCENTPLAVVGFEPTPPKRLEPKSSALDRSATLPHVAQIPHP